MKKEFLVIFLMIIGGSASASELKYQYKSPAFNGIGYSSHVLTIENLSFQREQEIKSEIESTAREVEREAKNTNVNKFLANLESRIYAELSKQVAEKLFGENPQTSGEIDLLGNKISYELSNEMVVLNVTQENGTKTVVEIPVGQFAF